MRIRLRPRWIMTLPFLLTLVTISRAQGTAVTVPLIAEHATSSHHAAMKLSDVVVWLTPVDAGAIKTPDNKPVSKYRLVQKDKMFSPHLLIVPTGANVEFPNLDPFFHNVFSLFNGKRFDLGLYEAHSSRSVRFDREGVSYIFCNIHPEMGAIVLALNTPFYATSSADGVATLNGVLSGSYRLHLWSETAEVANRAEDGILVQVGATPLRLNPIVLRPASNPAYHHLNKFGQEYHTSHMNQY